MYYAAQGIKGTGTAVEIGGFRIFECDEFGQSIAPEPVGDVFVFPKRDVRGRFVKAAK
jgi:hypothetical protein